MANKLTDEKREEMWLAFQEKQNNHYVAVKCNLNLGTVKKYRKQDDWDKRLGAIQVVAHRKADKKTADDKAKFLIHKAKMGQLLQEVGTHRFVDKEGLVKIADSDANAIRAIAEGVRIEGETHEGATAKLTITLELPVNLPIEDL